MFVSHEATFDGLLSAVAWCLRRRLERPVLLAPEEDPILLPVQPVATEPDIRAFFARHYSARLGRPSARALLEQAYTAYLSEQDGLATRLYRYFYLAWLTRSDPSGQLQDPDVAAVVQAAARVGAQAHQYLGLLRFRLVADAAYLAEFEPDYHVLPLILPHFIDRLPDQTFIICDRRRGLAAWHQPGRGCTLHLLADQAEAGDKGAPIPRLPLPGEQPVHAAAAADSNFSRMWSRYLSQLTIPERRNLLLQRSNLPLKYRRYLTEYGYGQNGTSARAE